MFVSTRLKQFPVVASRRHAVGQPSDLAQVYGVQDDERLVHAGDEGRISRLVASSQAGVEAMNDRIVPRAGSVKGREGNGIGSMRAATRTVRMAYTP